MFGAYVQESILRHWTVSGARQTIGQTELYPALIARTVWAARIDVFSNSLTLIRLARRSYGLLARTCTAETS